MYRSRGLRQRSIKTVKAMTKTIIQEIKEAKLEVELEKEFNDLTKNVSKKEYVESVLKALDRLGILEKL